MSDAKYGGFYICDRCCKPVKNGTSCGCMKQETRDMGTRNQVYYVAGKMRGVSYYAAEAFFKAQYELEQRGYTVLNPHHMDLEAGFDVFDLPEDHDWSTYAPGFNVAACHDRCIQAVKDCDAIYMLKGWRDSKGATAEHALAQWMGKHVVYEDNADYVGMRTAREVNPSVPDEIEMELDSGAVTGVDAAFDEPEGHDCWPELGPAWDTRGPGAKIRDAIDKYVNDQLGGQKPIGYTIPGNNPVHPLRVPGGTEAPNPANAGVAGGKPTDTENPKDAIGSGKLALHLWPATATMMGSIGLLNGMLKYGRTNWLAAGVRASIYYDACHRHLDAWFSGEDIDPDDNVPHLAAALACLAIIVDAGAAGKLRDDRSYTNGYRNLRDMLSPLVAQLKEQHKDKDPKHWTIGDK